MGTKKNDNPVFLELFSGCGGMSLGLLSAGWAGKLAIEKSPDAFYTLSHNLIKGGRFPYDWPRWLPQKPMTVETFLRNHSEKLKGFKGKIPLLAGGPPCQGFSVTGRRDPNDPRNKLTGQYLKVVELIRPKLLLLENVRGFTAAFKNAGARQAKPYSQLVQEKLEVMGYKVYSRIIKSCDWGIPQLRPRFFMIAIRSDVKTNQDPFSLLEETRSHFLQAKGLPTNKEISVVQAISDLETCGKEMIPVSDCRIKQFKQIRYVLPKHLTAYQKLMRQGMVNGTQPNSMRLARHTPEVQNRFLKILRTCDIRLSDKDRDRLGLKKHRVAVLSAELPAWTVTTLPDDIIHYSEPRILTVRETARLQSFPDWFEFQGMYTTGGDRRKHTCPRYTQVGNAVPPMLAEAIGIVLKKIIC